MEVSLCSCGGNSFLPHGFRNQQFLCTMYRLWVGTCSPIMASRATHERTVRGGSEGWRKGELAMISYKCSFLFCPEEAKYQWLNNDALSIFANFDLCISWLTCQKFLQFIFGVLVFPYGSVWISSWQIILISKWDRWVGVSRKTYYDSVCCVCEFPHNEIIINFSYPRAGSSRGPKKVSFTACDLGKL